MPSGSGSPGCTIPYVMRRKGSTSLSRNVVRQCAGISQPLDARVLHGDVRVEALGDGAGDEGGALLLEQLDQPLLLRHQRIDPRRLPVKESGDGALLGYRWTQEACIGDTLAIQKRRTVDVLLCVSRHKYRGGPVEIARF